MGSPVIQAILAPGPDQPCDEYKHSLGVVTNALSKASADEFKANVLASIPSSHVEVQHLISLLGAGAGANSIFRTAVSRAKLTDQSWSTRQMIIFLTDSNPPPKG